jgi:dolichyl-phosphate beta-glucosyltransferase
MIEERASAAGTVRLSIVLPAYNEEAKIGRDLARLFSYLEGRPEAAEVLVVDDGSTDRTAEVVRRFSQTRKNIRLIRLDGNRGKGGAVKTGVLAAQGRYILVADAGSCVPFENLERGLSLLEEGTCDAALGSRTAAGAVIRRRSPLWRRAGSWAFRRMVRLSLGLPGRIDTQCGFKLFERGAARRLFARNRIAGFMFDVELVLNARKLGLRLAEFPVDWTNDPDTRFHLVRGSLRNLKDLVRIRFGI